MREKAIKEGREAKPESEKGNNKNAGLKAEEGEGVTLRRLQHEKQT